MFVLVRRRGEALIAPYDFKCGFIFGFSFVLREEMEDASSIFIYRQTFSTLTITFITTFKNIYGLWDIRFWSGGNSTYGREGIPNMARKELHIWPVLGDYF